MQAFFECLLNAYSFRYLGKLIKMLSIRRIFECSSKKYIHERLTSVLHDKCFIKTIHDTYVQIRGSIHDTTRSEVRFEVSFGICLKGTEVSLVC